MSLVQIGQFLFGFLTIQNAITFIITATAMYLYQVYSGASAQYLGDKNTDLRRVQEERAKRLAQLRAIHKDMSAFIDALRDHLKTHPYVRKLLLMRSFNSTTVADAANGTVYNTDDKQQAAVVDQWIVRLSENDFLDIHHVSNTPQLILKDEFVELLGQI